MGETIKPFPCNLAGCSLMFTNEDHLRVHEKKHEIDLHIGIESQGSNVDQTPTPTRFIRNCEEVGLFQDLQNVNPFDETFQKAAELVKCGGLHVPQKSTDDSLHTPNVFPPSETTTSYQNNKDESSKKDVNGDKVESVLLSCLTNDKAPASNLDCLSPTPSSPGCLIIDDYDIEDRPQNEIEKSGVQTSNRTVTDFKSKLREALESKLNNQGNLISSFNSDKQDKIEFQIAAVKHSTVLQTADFIKSPTDEFLKEETKTVEQTIDGYGYQNDSRSKKGFDKKEMNRAAQIRSRQRKKERIRKMEKEVECLRTENKTLWLENQNLKFEVNALKKVFLLHKECSVSKDPEFDKKVTNILREMYNGAKAEKVPPKKRPKLASNLKPIAEIKIASNVLSPKLTRKVDKTSVPTPVGVIFVPTAGNNNKIPVDNIPKLLTIPPVQACLLTPLNVQPEKSLKKKKL